MTMTNNWLSRYGIPFFSGAEGGAPAAGGAESTTPGADAPVGNAIVDGVKGDDWSSMGTDFNDDVIEVVQEIPADKPKVEAPKPEVVAQPAKPAAPAKVEAPKPEAKPAPQAQPATPETQPAPAQADDEVAASPLGWAEQLSQHKDAIVGALAAERFALTKEDADALEVNPAEAIPRIAARVYYEATTTMLNHLANTVPKIIHEHMQLMTRHNDAEQAFYGKYPTLSKDAHARDIAQFAQVFRATNPQLEHEALLGMVAAAVMAKHGLAAAPAKANGVKPPAAKQAAFVPARPGTVVHAEPVDDNPFAGVGRSFDDDE